MDKDIIKSLVCVAYCTVVAEVLTRTGHYQLGFQPGTWQLYVFVMPLSFAMGYAGGIIFRRLNGE